MIRLINGDAKNHGGKFDMVFTDPPFEMSGQNLKKVLDYYQFDHLLLICSAHQMLGLYKLSDLDFAWQMVLDFKTPTKNRSYHQPHIHHANIAYFRKKGVKSAFDRRLVERQDHYSDGGNHYYPSIFHAPKNNLQYKYQKNQAMIDDLIGAFNVQSVCDMFAGSGSTGLACMEYKKNCTLIENNSEAFNIMKKNFSIFANIEIIEKDE